jgi:hypothetical protein
MKNPSCIPMKGQPAPPATAFAPTSPLGRGGERVATESYHHDDRRAWGIEEGATAWYSLTPDRTMLVEADAPRAEVRRNQAATFTIRLLAELFED